LNDVWWSDDGHGMMMMTRMTRDADNTRKLRFQVAALLEDSGITTLAAVAVGLHHVVCFVMIWELELELRLVCNGIVEGLKKIFQADVFEAHTFPYIRLPVVAEYTSCPRAFVCSAVPE
jgi:hypothetical protein